MFSRFLGVVVLLSRSGFILVIRSWIAAREGALVRLRPMLISEREPLLWSSRWWSPGEESVSSLLDVAAGVELGVDADALRSRREESGKRSLFVFVFVFVFELMFVLMLSCCLFSVSGISS